MRIGRSGVRSRHTPRGDRSILRLLLAAGLRLGVDYVVRVGAWLSLVEHSVRDRGVGGSNPLAPTNFPLRSKSVVARSFWPARGSRRARRKSSRPDHFRPSQKPSARWAFCCSRQLRRHAITGRSTNVTMAMAAANDAASRIARLAANVRWTPAAFSANWRPMIAGPCMRNSGIGHLAQPGIARARRRVGTREPRRHHREEQAGHDREVGERRRSRWPRRRSAG